MRMSSEARRVADPASDRPDVELSLTVVRYTDTADRCTVHPADAAGDRRMSTWLSADRSAFVDLEMAR